MDSERSIGTQAYRAMIVLSCLFACVAAYNFFQAMFDRGDMKNARKILSEFRGDNGLSIGEHLRAKHAAELVGDPVFEIEILSRFYGAIRATATVPLKPAESGGPRAAVYRWDVDVVRSGIHPADDAARAVIVEMQAGNSGPRPPVAGTEATAPPLVVPRPPEARP